jgi:hypothetical protein
MKYSENWFTKSAVTVFLLLLMAGCLVGVAAMSDGVVQRSEFGNATHELAERFAVQPTGSSYRLIPRAADIAHETRVTESGNGEERVTRASVNFNPRSFFIYTVLVWQDVKTKIDGEPVDMRIYYDAVPRGASSTRWRSQ